MAAEVAVQQLTGIARAFDGEGDSLARRLEAAGLGSLDFSSVETRIAWTDYAAILSLVAEQRGMAWLEDRGAESVHDPDALLFRRGLLIGFDDPAEALQWMIAPWGPFAAINPFIDNSLSGPAADGSWVLHARMRDGLPPSEPHLAFSAGVLREFPRVIHEPPAEVELHMCGDGADFRIRFADATADAARERREDRARPHADYLVGIGQTYLALAERQAQLQAALERERALERRAAVAEKRESLGFLTSGVAHDFNNVLAVVHGLLDLLRDDVGADHGGAIDEIVAACNRGSELSQRLLAYAAQAPSTPQDLSVVALLDDLAVMLRQALGVRVELRVAVPEVAPCVCVERGQFENVLLNLALNARDAMAGRGVFDIECASREVDAGFAEALDCAPGRYVAVTVRDDGCGMSEEVAARIFDPYFTTKGESGTGLGLATVWGFARQAGGTVRVESVTGVGTSFELLLPEVSAPTA